MSLRKYVVITKNVAESLGLQREVPRMWSTFAFFSYCIIPSYLPSASHRYRIHSGSSRTRSSQVPLKVNTLENLIIHCSYVSQLVRFSTRAYHPFAMENIWKARIFSTALHSCITYSFPGTRRKVLVVQARGQPVLQTLSESSGVLWSCKIDSR